MVEFGREWDHKTRLTAKDQLFLRHVKPVGIYQSGYQVIEVLGITQGMKVIYRMPREDKARISTIQYNRDGMEYFNTPMGRIPLCDVMRTDRY